MANIDLKALTNGAFKGVKTTASVPVKGVYVSGTAETLKTATGNAFGNISPAVTNSSATVVPAFTKPASPKTPSVTTVTGSHKSGKIDTAPTYDEQITSLQTRLDALKKRKKQLEDEAKSKPHSSTGIEQYKTRNEGSQAELSFVNSQIAEVEFKINDVETKQYDEKIKSKFDKNLTTTDRRTGEKKTTGENLIDLYTQYENARKRLTAEQTMNMGNHDAAFMPDASEVNALRKKLDAYGLSKQDEAELREYVNRQNRAEEAERSNASAKAFAESRPGLASAASVPMNLATGVGTVEVVYQNARNAVREIIGKDKLPIDYNTPGLSLSRDTQTIRGTVAEDVEKKYGKVASFAYQTGMSMADSLAVMAVSAMGAPTMLSSSLLGGSAATNGILEAKNRGATDTQALFVGLANGVFETLFENVSLEKLFSTNTPDTLGQAILNIVTQAFTEGSEEVNTSVANTLADLIIMGDRSEFEQMLASYINAGYEPDEAQKLAAQEWAQGLLMDFIGGAVSGGIFGSAANITTNIRAAQIGDTMTFDEVNTLVDEAKQYDGVKGAKQAVRMASDIESGKTYVTRRVAGRLYEEVNNAREAAKNKVSPAASQNANAVEQARTETAAINPNSDVLDTATTAFVKMGMSLKTAKAKADVVARLVAGESVTNREINTLDPTSKKIQKAFSELTGVAFPDGKIDRNRLYGLYRSASELAEQARQDAKMDQASASQAEGTAAEVVQQVMQNAQNAQTEQLAGNAATEEPSTAVAPSEPTITMSDGGTLTKSEFIEAMRKQPGTEDMTDEQLSGFFDHAVAQNITMNRSTEGENTNGRNTLSDEGLQRADSQSSAEQAAGVEGSARTSEANVDTGAGSRENAAVEGAESESAAGSEESGRNLEAAKKVRSLNLKTSRIGHKSSNADVSYNEVHTYDREKIEGYKEAEEEAKAHGVKLTPVIGLIEGTTTVDGKSFDVSANGMHEPGKVWARADDPDMSFRQGVRHEIYHEEVENDADVRAAHEEFVKTMRNDPFIDQLVKLAYDDVSGAYGVSLGEYDANASDYYEELCADISADYDRIPDMDPLVKDILRSVFAESMSGTRAALDVGETVTAADTTSTEPATKMSIVSLSDASGVQVDKDENGKIIFKVDGKQVNEISADHIKNESGLGALIKVAEQDGRISGDEAKNQYQMAADIMNMIMKTQDPDTVWAVAGSAMFSAVKSNSDGQYGTTIDFSTVCRKTQNMINAMSEVMTTERRGLTKDEVTRLQKDLIEEGSDVPCPVCYVFSRWAGIGGILENMYKWQNKYDGYTAEQLQSSVEELSDKLGKGKAKDLKKFLKEQDERYDFLDREIYRLSREKTKLNQSLKKAKKAGDAAQMSDIQNSIDENVKKTASAKKELDAIKKSVAPELAWLKQVRMEADYETKGKVDPDILFNMNRAAEFTEYSPLAWTYRTTRGPSAGKAILPYSDMRLGDLILGVKNTSADGNQTFKTVENGKFNEEQKAAIVKAIARTKAQNLIGGQRYQSTSDFRYDYALDYLQSFWEAQALGSNMQTYTKIVEFADMVAAVGGDANLSVMPKNKGYVELPDGSKRLIFSSVTGMDFDVAKEASQKHDNVQLILVGINDEHIKLALQDSEETGGAYIGFVIPYHASGASINEFISALVSNLNEDFVVEYYQDYSKAQTDSVKENATADQNRRRSLRSAILKGTVSTKDSEGKTHTTKWEPSAEDLAFIQQENVDISDRSFDDLRDVELRALGGDENAIREYESWTAGALADIYNKLWVDENSKYKDVRLNSAQAETVMPHEYWNTSVDREHAYINGFLFRSYCYNLGLKPRFSGITEKGKTYGDFTSEAGYWKTLIDRPMYDNRGQYRDQQAINVSGFKQDMLTSDYGEREWAGHVIANPDPAKAHNAAQKFMTRETQKAVALSNEANFENRTLAAQRERNESSDTQSKFSLRKEDPPKKTGIAYKVFLAVDGKLYPPMVANPGGAETPVGVWLNADAAPRAADSKTGRPQVQAGGKGTNTGKTQLAYRPGWHLGDVPVAKQFAKVNPETGQKELFPANFVWAECEYAADADYQDEAMSYGYTENGKFRHSYAGLPRVPENGFYRYRTNPNPDTVPWVITGAMKVNKILNDDEVAEICKANGVEPMQRLGGPINLEALGFGEKEREKAVKQSTFSFSAPPKSVSNIKKVVSGTMFSGGGTVDTALASIIDSEFAVEYDAKISAVYQNNNDTRFMGADVRDFDSKRHMTKDVQFLHASPVCKTYSSAISNAGRESRLKEGIDYTTAKAVAESLRNWEQDPNKPYVFTLENVVGYKNSLPLKLITDTLTELGYEWDSGEYNAADFGAATSRERFFIRAIKNGKLPPKPVGNKQSVSWMDAASDLIPNLKEAKTVNPRMIQSLRDISGIDVSKIEKPLFVFGESYKNGEFGHAFSDSPLPTIIAKSGASRIFMPDGRVLEADARVLARISGLPDSYELPKSETLARTIVGNGVPVKLTQGVIGDLLKQAYPEQTKASKFSAAQIDQEAQDRNNNEQFQRFIDSLDKDYGAGMGEKMMAAFTNLDASRKAAAAAAAETYGMIPQGEAPTREARIPAQMNDKTKVHKTVRTVVEAEATPESRLPDIGSAVVDGKLSYTPKTNKIAVNKAEAKLKNGWRQAVDNWKKDVYSGKVSAELVALGAEILNNAGNAEDSKVSGAEYVDLLVDYCDLLKRAGQSVQAAKILKKLTPSARLYGLQRVVQKYNDLEEVQRRIPDGVVLDPTLVDRYNKARTDAERDTIIDELTQDIADQLPTTWTDRLTALRYLNMLGNFKTQIRNVVGNAVFQPVRLVKDGVKVILEVVTGAERTTSFTWNKETYLDCLDDFDSFADEVMSGGKYKPGAKIDADIEEKRQIFGKTGIRAWDKTLGRGLEAYRKATNWAMDKGDVVFCKATYADAMAKYLKAKKTTFQNASEEILDSARAYAIRQAAEATYRDNNQFSDFISRIRVKNPDTATAKAAYAVTEGVLTFRKTPANILVRAVEYSPIGLLTTGFQAMQDVKNNTTYENGKKIVGKVDTAKLIENLAKNITGVGIVALGYALSQQSLFKKIKLVGAGSDDDKEKDFDVLTGHQDYCIELPSGLTFTLDWLAPECIPLFIGANLSEQVMRDGWSFKAGLDAIGRITDPMLEMSMLSGLDDAFKNAQTYGDDKALPRFVENALWSYFTQFTTNTLLGQVARSLTNTSYATYIDKNSPLSSDQQKMIGKFLAKVPMNPEKKFGQIPRIDAWGRIQTNYENETKNIIGQFFNPAYVSRVNESDVDKELRRLYKSTKESVFPDKANTYFNVKVDDKSERLNLSAEQYLEYAMEKGSTSYTLLEQALKQPYYKSLSDKEKADFVNDLYKYADQLAKAKVSGYNLSGEAPNGSYSPDSWVMEAYEAKGKGIQVCDYINAKNVTSEIKSLKDANGKSISNTSGLQKMQAIYAMGFTQSQCEYLFEAFGVGKTVIGYSSSEVNAALKDLQAKAR